MKLVSWNVNGLRACLGKGFLDFCAFADADVICLQETKMRPEQASFDLPGYERYWNSADKAGYSGTAIFTRKTPLAVTYDFGIDEHRHEGRVITAEYPEFYLVCCYTPNSQDGLKRLDYRMEWEDDLRDYLLSLDRHKPVIYCGDLNVAHQEIDLKNPKTNRGNAGFSDEDVTITQMASAGYAAAIQAGELQGAVSTNPWSAKKLTDAGGVVIIDGTDGPTIKKIIGSESYELFTVMTSDDLIAQKGTYYQLYTGAFELE